MSVRSRISAIVALTVFAFLTVAGGASALTIRDVHKRKLMFEPLTLHAKCPRGTHVVSGGATATGGELKATKKKKNGWTATGFESLAGAYLRVDAYCANRNFHLQSHAFRSATTPVSDVFSRCPNRTNLISGGASVAPGDGYLKASLPQPSTNGWEAKSAPNPSLSLTAYAYCAPKRMHLDWHTLVSASSPTVEARCRPDEFVISGGGQTAGGYLASTNRASDGWTTSSTAPSDAVTSTVGCL
jgi:hypothetical protein